MAVTGFRRSVVALTVLIATAVVAILVVVSHVLLSRVTDADAHDLARTRAEAVASNVTAKGGRVVLTENGSEALDEVAWVYADGHLIDGNVPVSMVRRVQELVDAGRSQTATVGDSLLYARTVPVDGHHVMVVVRVDLTPYETSEQRSLTLSLILGGLTIALAGGVAHVVVRRALRVVHEMAALADDWGHHEPGRRFNLGVPRDEFGELGQTLDRLLERVDNALADERRLTDEIAHELRTPLTVLRGEAQLAQLSGEPVPPEAVLNEVERLDAAITTILRAARARTDEGTRCDLRAAARQAIGGRAVEVAVPAKTEVAVAPDVAVSLLSPLLENGLRHARTRVWITARTQGAAVVVDVLDDGPGIDPADVERVFEAGVTGGDGFGLGLPVVRRIAASAGAEVRAIADGRGHVEVTLPAAGAVT
ncbi:sensor histidine kinase [Streptomyces stelliscabiei]|uniref:sensor histidine kinase n=1 Tax=Streptomyces stelliscabiei TaxID=146820 RepID=UPI0029A9D245|nr:HAMP domain-containing sensor histidine kinase [Streptomyces stelliscabiei]MDX2661088.1 HAMP domain-containing sensor histidine kinase [Streptomyces stelliscabiei]MDX2715955.1 HAMP domain-containing sensor histidine kinase [Streptomyces stelliscabiei]MDX2790065.1 HAMP domain-containing sensor histidine kinase [Streptomyces stelliscabiei]